MTLFDRVRRVTVHLGVALAALVTLSSEVSAQAGSFQQALNTLQQNHPLPPGWTARLGKSDTGYAGETNPRTKTIVIDPGAIAAHYPGIGSTQANLPGVLYIFLLHEWYHANECGGGSANAGGGGSPPYNSPCGEIQLQPGIAAQQCALIQAIFDGGNGHIAALCTLYNDVRNNYNVGHDGQGALGAYVRANCTGPEPHPIPACALCGS